MPRKRRVCFVTGTRAEFGLMRRTLEAIRAHPSLQLQIIATGMHLDRSRGRTIHELAEIGFAPDVTLPWKSTERAVATGTATASLARAFRKLRTEIVLVVGDRVEAFAAAAAGVLSEIPVAHVHGGDRAVGLVDDSLRHAISKLSHIHFPATVQSAGRLYRLGEEPGRIHLVGAPGIDGIRGDAGSQQVAPRGKFALMVLHPASESARIESSRARGVLKGVLDSGVPEVVIVHPNNDPGSEGIVRQWNVTARNARVTAFRNAPRSQFLALLRDAVALVGNSSSGIIEAASFGTPVIDVGERQRGREHSGNLVHVDYSAGQITRALRQFWRSGNLKRFEPDNVYGGAGTARRIAQALAKLQIDGRLLRKLISY